MEVEVLSPEDERHDERQDGRPRLAHVRVLGIFGTGLALLTMLAAFGVGFLALFGTTIAASLAAWALWPLVFSPQFSEFVFGSSRAPFWKLFLLFLAAGAVAKLFRRLSGGR